MSFVAAAPTPMEPDVKNHPFWPDISPVNFRSVMAIDGTVTAQRLSHALTEAIISTNKELKAWRMQQEADGYVTLNDVPFDIPDQNRYLYIRAVFCKAKADLMERMLNFDSTAAGQKKAAEQEPAIDDYRRNARWAIRDLMGISRSTVELI